MYNHNAPPLANLGPVLNNGQNGGSGNWNESQRMRGKIRYGSRNANNRHQQQQQQQHHGAGSSGYGGNSIPQINNMKTSSVPVNNMVLNQNSGPSPRGTQSNQLTSTLGRGKGSRRQNRNRNTDNRNTMDLNASLQNGLNSGNVGAGGSIYLDSSSSNDQGTGAKTVSKYGQQNQMLPRIGSSQQQNHAPLVKRNSNRDSSMQQQQQQQQSGGMPNMYGNHRSSPTPMPLSPSRSNSQLNASGGGGGGTAARVPPSGSHSIKGYKPSNPHNWINQDNFFVLENIPYANNTFNNIYCVLDGHGEHGHIVSKRCTELLPQLLTAKNCQLPPGQNANGQSQGGINYYYDYKRAFLGTQSDLNNNTHTIVDASCSGATCVMININLSDGVIITANAGDSRAVIASSKRSSQGSGQVSFIATPLSYDHKPDRQDERKRILACNGRVGCRQMAVPNSNRVSVPNASGGSSIPSMISVPVGPCRVWYSYKGDTLGLAMSRSIGDCVVHQSGVSAEPELVVYKLNNGVVDGHGNVLTDEFVVLATDGIWDVLDNNTVVQLVVQNFINPSNGRGNWNCSDAAAFLCKTARAKWEKLSPMIDDITCIVVKLSQ